MRYYEIQLYSFVNEIRKFITGLTVVWAYLNLVHKLLVVSFDFERFGLK